MRIEADVAPTTLDLRVHASKEITATPPFISGIRKPWGFRGLTVVAIVSRLCTVDGFSVCFSMQHAQQSELGEALVSQYTPQELQPN